MAGKKYSQDIKGTTAYNQRAAESAAAAAKYAESTKAAAARTSYATATGATATSTYHTPSGETVIITTTPTGETSRTVSTYFGGVSSATMGQPTTTTQPMFTRGTPSASVFTGRPYSQPTLQAPTTALFRKGTATANVFTEKPYSQPQVQPPTISLREQYARRGREELLKLEPEPYDVLNRNLVNMGLVTIIKPKKELSPELPNILNPRSEYGVGYTKTELLGGRYIESEKWVKEQTHREQEQINILQLNEEETKKREVALNERLTRELPELFESKKLGVTAEESMAAPLFSKYVQKKVKKGEQYYLEAEKVKGVTPLVDVGLLNRDLLNSIQVNIPSQKAGTFLYEAEEPILNPLIIGTTTKEQRDFFNKLSGSQIEYFKGGIAAEPGRTVKAVGIGAALAVTPFILPALPFTIAVSPLLLGAGFTGLTTAGAVSSSLELTSQKTFGGASFTAGKIAAEWSGYFGGAAITRIPSTKLFLKRIKEPFLERVQKIEVEEFAQIKGKEFGAGKNTLVEKTLGTSTLKIKVENRLGRVVWGKKEFIAQPTVEYLRMGKTGKYTGGLGADILEVKGKKPVRSFAVGKLTGQMGKKELQVYTGFVKQEGSPQLIKFKGLQQFKLKLKPLERQDVFIYSEQKGKVQQFKDIQTGTYKISGLSKLERPKVVGIGTEKKEPKLDIYERAERILKEKGLFQKTTEIGAYGIKLTRPVTRTVWRGGVKVEYPITDSYLKEYESLGFGATTKIKTGRVSKATATAEIRKYLPKKRVKLVPILGVDLIPVPVIVRQEPKVRVRSTKKLLGLQSQKLLGLQSQLAARGFTENAVRALVSAPKAVGEITKIVPRIGSFRKTELDTTTKLISNLRTDLKPSTKTITRTELKPMIKSVTRIELKPTTRTSLKPSLRTTLRTELKPVLRTNLRMGLRPSLVPLIPSRPTGIVFGFPLKAAWFKPSAGYGYEKYKRKLKYQSSLVAAEYKIKGRRSQVEREVLTGLEIRPIAI